MTEVRIIGLTQPGTLGLNGNYFDPNIKTPEDIVVYCARVSNPTNQTNMETGAKLLKHCIKNNHWSVFESVTITMEITTTRDIARQILRHRSFTFQEFSQRYAEVQAFEYREARLQDHKNRQNSIETDDLNLQEEWWVKQDEVLDTIKDAYKWALDKGIAKEQARAVLPEGMSQSILYMQGTLRSWMHYCILRMDKSTQLEHRFIAEMCYERLKVHFPQTLKSLEL